jgi:ABC-type branched-subunit amino acid transport system permease subunit
MRRLATAWLALLAALGVGAVVAPLVLPPHIVTLLSLVFIAGLLAASVDLLAGLVGLVSIGHAGIAAAAGYAVAWATLREHGVVVQLGLALAVTLVVSAVYALTTMRTNGIVFLMITLALGIVVYGLALKLSTITGGQNGLTGVRRPDAIADPVAFYFVAAAAFAVAAAFRWVLARSPFGLVLRGARESESRMSSLGYSVARAKFVAVMLSGLLAGIAGVLIVWQAQFMSPNVFVQPLGDGRRDGHPRWGGEPAGAARRGGPRRRDGALAELVRRALADAPRTGLHRRRAVRARRRRRRPRRSRAWRHAGPAEHRRPRSERGRWAVARGGATGVERTRATFGSAVRRGRS